MEVETKYDIGLDVYAIVDDKPARYEVDSITIVMQRIALGGISKGVYYGLQGIGRPNADLKEEQVFGTEEEMFEEISQRLK